MKIDSNITGAAYAEEASLGILNAPVWRRLEPNSYSDFGGELTTVAPSPIEPSRQRKKGVVTDLDASGGFNHNLTSTNLTDLFQGLMFADIRRKGHAEVTSVVTTGGVDEYNTTAPGAFLINSLVKGVGFANSVNNAVSTVTNVGAGGTLIEVGAGNLTDETPLAGAYIQAVGHLFDYGDLTVDVSGDLPALTSTSVDLTTLGLVAGQWVFIGGDAAVNQFSSAVNNGFKRVRSITPTKIIIDKSAAAMSAESSAAKQIHLYFGDVLRNETGVNIVRRSYHIERTLGAPDPLQPSQVQSEYLKGAVVNQASIKVPAAGLVNIDFSFIATDRQQNTSVIGPLQNNVVSPEASDVFNTSSDIARIKMALVSSTNPAPTPLFVFITEATVDINNNVTPNKAVGVLGAFDVTAGTFEVGGEITAYFTDVSSVAAVTSNSDVTLDFCFVKGNKGIVLDIPLLSLSGGKLNVEKDQPITIPLSVNAATAEDVADGLDHTLLFTLFKYLPNLAN